MAIADVFEALTALDRPYKKAKTLSESVRILYGFKRRLTAPRPHASRWGRIYGLPSRPARKSPSAW